MDHNNKMTMDKEECIKSMRPLTKKLYTTGRFNNIKSVSELPTRYRCCANFVLQFQAREIQGGKVHLMRKRRFVIRRDRKNVSMWFEGPDYMDQIGSSWPNIYTFCDEC